MFYRCVGALEASEWERRRVRSAALEGPNAPSIPAGPRPVRSIPSSLQRPGSHGKPASHPSTVSANGLY